MTGEPPPSHDDKKGDGSEKSEKHSKIEEQIGLPLRELAQRVETLIGEVRTQRETDHSDRQSYQKQESDRLRVDTCWNRVLSVLTFGVGALTLWVLLKTYGVYNTMSQTYSTQATIMATQAMITDEQRKLTEKTLQPMKEQASAASTQASASLTNAQAAASSAEEARKANEQALATFRAEESARISLQGISAQQFGTPSPSIKLELMNNGKSAAFDILVRWMMITIPKDLIISPVNLGLFSTNPILSIDIQNLNEALNRYTNIVQAGLDKSVDHAHQSPKIPPEEFFSRQDKIVRRLRKKLIRDIAKTEPDEPPSSQFLALPFLPTTEMMLAGELDQGVPLSDTIPQGANAEVLSKLKEGETSLYFVVRLRYRDSFGEHTTPDFCFYYVPADNGLNECQSLMATK